MLDPVFPSRNRRGDAVELTLRAQVAAAPGVLRREEGGRPSQAVGYVFLDKDRITVNAGRLAVEGDDSGWRPKA